MTNAAGTYSKQFLNGRAPEAANTAAAPAGKAERIPAEFWLNVGYQVEREVDGQPVKRFIALPGGLPLDTMNKLDLKGSGEYLEIRSAQNSLHDQFMEKAQTLKPGEEVIIGDGPIVIQLRRVSGPKEVAEPSANTFIKKVF